MRKINKLFSLLAVVAVMGLASPLLAKEKKSEATPVPTPVATPSELKVTVGGMIDSYYTYNFTNSAHDLNGFGNTGLYGFNQTDNSYSLGLAEVTVTAVQGPATGKITLIFGETASLLAGVDPNFEGYTGFASGNLGLDANILEAKASYTAGQWTFTGGKFVTWMGNEVIESKSNMNYSRGLLFWTIPAYHTGLAINLQADEKFGVTGYITNGWNSGFAADIKGEKTYGLNAVIKPDTSLTIVLNGIFGPQPLVSSAKNYIAEGIITLAATDKLTLAFDGQWGSQDQAAGSGLAPLMYLGGALYGRYQMEEGWALALRLEELLDTNGYFGGSGALFGPPAVAGEIREVTLTVEKAFAPNVLFRVEGRYDYRLVNGTPLPQGSGNFAAGDMDQVTGTGSAVLSF